MPTTIKDRTEMEKQIEWDNENDRAMRAETLTVEPIGGLQERRRPIAEHEILKRSIDTYEFLYGTDLTEGYRRSCKGRLFRYIFSKPEWALQLYNALTKAHYEDPSQISITATDGYLNLEIYGYASLFINADMMMWEAGSTYDPSMVLSPIPKIHARHSNYDLSALVPYHQTKLQPIPIPLCYRLYNGGTDKPDLEVVRLSEIYSQAIEQMFGDEGNRDFFGKRLAGTGFVPFDFAVIMVNLDHEKNQDLLDECRPLKEYAWFVSQVKQKLATFERGLSWSIDRVLDQLPQDFVIHDHLMQTREAVFAMAYEDFCEQLFRDRKAGERATTIAVELIGRGRDFMRSVSDLTHQFTDEVNRLGSELGIALPRTDPAQPTLA